MAVFTEKKFIDVLNCENNVVVVPTTNGRSYAFKSGSVDEPFVFPIPSEELPYMNSASNAFKSGTLRFRKEEADEIYKELGIKDFSMMLFIEDIDELLLHPSIDNLNKIIKVVDSGQFERIRGRYYWLINNNYSIEVRVGQIIEQRYLELRTGKRKTNITITPKNNEKSEDNVQELLDKQKKELNAEFDKKMDEMTKKMEEMMQMMASMASGSVVATIEEKPTSSKKSRAKKVTEVKDKDV